MASLPHFFSPALRAPSPPSGVRYPTHGSWAEWDTADSDVPKSSDQDHDSVNNTIVQTGTYYLVDRFKLNIFFVFLKVIQSCWRWRKSGSRTKKRDSPSRLWERLKYCASSSTRTSSSSGWALLSANCTYSSVGYFSVADPGCLSRIQDPCSQHLIDKEFKYVISKYGTKLSEIWFGMFILDLGSRSRIQWSKKHEIPDPGNPEQQNMEILVNFNVIFLLLGNCDGQIRGGGFSEGQGLLLSGLRLHGARSHGAHWFRQPSRSSNYIFQSY